MNQNEMSDFFLFLEKLKFWKRIHVSWCDLGQGSKWWEKLKGFGRRLKHTPKHAFMMS